MTIYLKKAIISTHNANLSELNWKIFKKIDSEKVVYYNTDYIKPKGTDESEITILV